jgi:hypothetical protein
MEICNIQVCASHCDLAVHSVTSTKDNVLLGHSKDIPASLRAAAHQLRQDKHQHMRQKHHDSDRCAAVFIIPFVSTVLLSLRVITDIAS